MTGPDRTADLEQEVADLRALFDMQWKRMGEATARWRAEDPEARALIAPDLGDLLKWLMDSTDALRAGWSDPVALVRALRLTDAGVEDKLVWYRALSPDGELWCESSDPQEVAKSVAGRKGYTLQRLPSYLVRTPWEPWQPDQEEPS